MLIARADGELPSREESRVVAHLQQCWECRGRLAELEETAGSLAQLAARNPFGGPNRAAEAKVSFLEWRREFERELAPRQHARQHFASLQLPTLAAAIALLIVGAALWLSKGWGRPRPVDVLAKAQQHEQALIRTDSVLHQVINIEVLETAPENRRGSGRLEVWADGRGQRYASRWMEGKGGLSYAVWQPSRGQAWRYDPRAARYAVAVTVGQSAEVTLADVDASRFEEFESGVLDWVRKRAWRPVEVIGDFARFAARGGYALEAQKFQSADGRPVLRLTTRWVGPRAAVEFVLELDPDSYRPRLQQATYRTAERVFIIRLDVARYERVPQARIEPAVFVPEQALLAPHPRPVLTSPLLLPLPPATLVTQGPPSAEAEVETMFASHLSGACVANPVAPALIGVHSGAIDVIQRRIERRLRALDSRRTPGEVAGEAVALATSGLQEAAEIRRLAEWATPEKTGQLDAHGWRLLNAMIQDHVASLRNWLSATRGLLDPLLSGDGIPNMTSPPHGSKAKGEPWAAGALHVFSHLERVERRVREVFMHAEHPPDDVDRAISEILEDLPAAEQELGWLRAEWVLAMRRGVELASGGRKDAHPRRKRN